jgi:hypothetical protein
LWSESLPSCQRGIDSIAELKAVKDQALQNGCDDYFFVGSVVCWYFVLSPRAREKYSRPVRDFYRSRKEHQGMFEASSFAAALVGAIFFTIFFLALLAMRIAG